MAHPGPAGRRHIAYFVPDHPGIEKIEIETLRRFQNHSGLRFPTVASLFGSMRAEKNLRAFHRDTCLGHLLQHPFGQALKILSRIVSASYSRLIRHNDGQVSLLKGLTHQGQNPLYKAEIFYLVYIAVIHIDHSVPIEKQCTSHLFTLFAPGMGIERYYT